MQPHRTPTAARLSAVALIAGLASGLAAAQPDAPAGAVTPDLARCPPAQAAVLERFLNADCADCWSAPAVDAAPLAADPRWRFDWIAAGRDDAPLSAAALNDTADRLQRLGHTTPATSWQRLQAPAPGAAAQAGLQAHLGPAWLGRYMALEFVLTLAPTSSAAGAAAPALPAGSSGWLAMVELLPAGTDGSPLARELLRNVAGPLPLDSAQAGAPLHHLRAMRWPESADPTRLQARAWVEAPDGSLLAVAADRCP